MKHLTIIVPLILSSCALAPACTPAALDRVQAASDAREYACRYLAVLDAANPRVAQAQQLCEQSADVQAILAAAAGVEACAEVHGEVQK